MLKKVTKGLRHVEGVVVAHRKTALNDAREALPLGRGVEKLGEPSIDWTKRRQNAIIVPSVATPREPPSTKKDDIQDRRCRVKGVSHFASYF